MEVSAFALLEPKTLAEQQALKEQKELEDMKQNAKMLEELAAAESLEGLEKVPMDTEEKGKEFEWELVEAKGVEKPVEEKTVEVVVADPKPDEKPEEEKEKPVEANELVEDKKPVEEDTPVEVVVVDAQPKVKCKAMPRQRREQPPIPPKSAAKVIPAWRLTIPAPRWLPAPPPPPAWQGAQAWEEDESWGKWKPKEAWQLYSDEVVREEGGRWDKAEKSWKLGQDKSSSSWEQKRKPEKSSGWEEEKSSGWEEKSGKEESSGWEKKSGKEESSGWEKDQAWEKAEGWWEVPCMHGHGYIGMQSHDRSRSGSGRPSQHGRGGAARSRVGAMWRAAGWMRTGSSSRTTACKGELRHGLKDRRHACRYGLKCQRCL